MRGGIAPVGQISSVTAECRAEFPDLSSRTVVFIRSHIVHPLHICPPLMDSITMRNDRVGKPQAREASNEYAHVFPGR